MLLHRFTDESGKLFFFNKRHPEKGVIATSPRNLFCQTHLYTAKSKDGEIDVELERHYADLEGRASPVVDKIVTCARNGRRPHLSAKERAIWDLVFYHQWKRVPDVRDQIFDRMDIDSTVKEAAQLFEALARPLTPREARDLQDPRWIARIKQNATVSALAHSSQDVLDVLAQKGICIAVIRKPHKAFVIGSRPVVKLTHRGREHLADATVEVWLPIAYDIIVGPAPITPTDELLRDIWEDSIIRCLNRATFIQSTAVAGKSQKLVASLARSTIHGHTMSQRKKQR
jgi:hypothetical protein